MSVQPNFDPRFVSVLPHAKRGAHDAAGLPGGNAGGNRRAGRRTKGATNMSATALAHPTSNATTFEQLLAQAKELGEQAGKGKDTQIKFFIASFSSAFQGKIDVDPNKHGDGIDDAFKLAEAYVLAQGSATIFDQKAANQRKARSCVRTAIKLGMWPKGGVGEPQATVNELLAMRQTFRKNPSNAKLLDDAGNTFLRYARAQIKLDQLIPASELRQFCFKRDHDAADAEAILERIRKTAEELRDGKASKNTAQDNSPEVLAIINACTKRLSAIAKGKPIVGTPAAAVTV